MTKTVDLITSSTGSVTFAVNGTVIDRISEDEVGKSGMRMILATARVLHALGEIVLVERHQE